MDFINRILNMFREFEPDVILDEAGKIVAITITIPTAAALDDETESDFDGVAGW